MQKPLALLLLLTLAFTLAACGSPAAPEESALPAPSPTPTAAPTEAPTPARDPAAAEAALGLFAALFENGLAPCSAEGVWELAPCDVLAGDPATFGEYSGNPVNWSSAFALYDLDLDDAPELILESGPVEKTISIFDAADGQVHYKATTLSGNYSPVSSALWVYATESGSRRFFSVGTAGTGAGTVAFAYEIEPGLSVAEHFYSYYDVPDALGGNLYEVEGQSVSEEEYTAAYDAFFGSMEPVEQVLFTALGTDPAASLNEAAEPYLNHHFPQR